MPEYVRDNDGDVWTYNRDYADQWYSPGLRTRSWDEISEFGPLVPCDVDGEPLSPAPDTATRALVAAALGDFVDRLSFVYYGDGSDTQHLLEHMREMLGKTADAVRTGQVGASSPS